MKQSAIVTTYAGSGKCKCYPKGATWNPPRVDTPAPNRGPCDAPDCRNVTQEERWRRGPSTHVTECKQCDNAKALWQQAMCPDCERAWSNIIASKVANKQLLREIDGVVASATERGDIAQADVALMALDALDLASKHGDDAYVREAERLIKKTKDVAS